MSVLWMRVGVQVAMVYRMPWCEVDSWNRSPGMRRQVQLSRTRVKSARPQARIARRRSSTGLPFLSIVLVTCTRYTVVSTENSPNLNRRVPRHPDRARTRGDPQGVWGAATRGGLNEPVVLVGVVGPVLKGHDDMAGKTRSACKRAGLAPLTFHSLRATYATLVADAGLPIGKLSALLGHSDIATTAIYIRPESAAAATDPRAILGGAASNGDGTKPELRTAQQARRGWINRGLPAEPCDARLELRHAFLESLLLGVLAGAGGLRS